MAAAFDPLNVCGMVMTASDEEGPLIVTGSGFLFRSNRLALTAGHCVPLGTAVALVYLPRLGKNLVVTRVERHPTADLALLHLDAEDTRGPLGYATQAFLDGVSNWGLGEEVMAYGFPAVGEPAVNVSSAGDDGIQLFPPRLFRGYFQRFLNYTTPQGLTYLAGELNIPAPGGLSGSPLFRPGVPMVVGVVTANVESYAVVDSIVEVDDDGRVYREEARRVFSYGLGLMLSGVADWLNEQTAAYVPPNGQWVLIQAN